MSKEVIYLQSLKNIKKLLSDVIKENGVVAYLFGSRARSDYKGYSDIDIAIQKASKKSLILLKEKLEESNIPYKIDIIDLSDVSEDFKENILKEAKVLWKN